MSAKTKEMTYPKKEKLSAYEDGTPRSRYMQELCVVLGKNLREERKSRKFTMEELVNMLTISESYLGLLERGKRTPSIECLFELCRTFSVTPNDLLLSREKNKKQLLMSDSAKASKSENFNAAMCLLRSFSETELEYVVSVMTAMQKMNKKKRITVGE